MSDVTGRINGRSIQTLLRGENDSKQSDEFQAKEQIVRLKDADPNELQLFIDKMPATIKGKSVKYGF